MSAHRRSELAIAIAVTVLVIATGSLGAAAQPVTSLEGTVASATATSATITTEQGQTTVILTPKTRVIRHLPAGVRDIRVGSFLGVAATKQPNGTLLAVSVNILDAVKRIARSGQFPMASGNIMTNAGVTAVVVKKAGRSIKMDYDGKSAFVYIPDNVAIHRSVLGTPADLKRGQHVTVRGDADGGRIMAASITIQ
ncbi:MAG TPA: DUF5666 domain-containing protein [bacterium]|nr:DUF5666 domain-containing protein [bacterium]